MLFARKANNKLRRKLIKFQSELRNHCKQVIKDVGLVSFILIPHLVSQEEIDFYRQTELSLLALGYDQVKVLCNKGMRPQISFNVLSVQL